MHMRQNVILIGFMGCGKTTVGQILAEKLGWEFADTDHIVVQHARRTISEIFRLEGEAEFRKKESAVLSQLATGDHRIISSGGGIVTQPENESLLKALGFVVWLNATEQIIFERVSRNRSRPLLQTSSPPGCRSTAPSPIS
jgi:shikimate kinase